MEITEQQYPLRAFGSQVLLTTGTNLLLGFLGLITAMMGARLLGAAGRGELAAIQAWPIFIATLGLLGLPDALVYFSARQPRQAGRYLGSAVAFVLLASGPFVVLGYLAMPALLATQSPQVIAAARCSLVLVPLYALVQLPWHPLRGHGDLVFWNGLRVVPAVGWLMVLLVGFLLRRTTSGFAAAGYLVMMAALAVPTVYIVARRVPGPYWPERRKAAAMLRYGLPSMISSIPQFLNLRLGQLVMAGLLPAVSLGLYTTALSWSTIASPALTGLAAVLFPRVASLPAGKPQVNALAQASHLGIWLSAAIAVSLALPTPWLLPLVFGRDFAPAIPAAVALLLAGVIAGWNSIIEEGMRGLGHPRAAMWSEIAGLAVASVALLLLVRPLGIMGAGLATLLGNVTVATVLVCQARWLTGCSCADLLCPTVAEISLAWQRIQHLGAQMAAMAWTHFD